MFFLTTHAQFTLQDTLRGTITPERQWWDLTYYHLDIDVDPETRSISGSNMVRFIVLEADSVLQIDLQPPMKMKKAMMDGQELRIEKVGNAHYIHCRKKLEKGGTYDVTIDYEGQPKVSRRPPWDGGMTWTKDSEGHDFIASSCQGDGASLWWPCKDHPYDEPDSILMSVTVPDPLMDVSNGRLISVDKNDNGTSTYHWFVANPINHYGVNINIARYEHFSEVYIGEDGGLDCHYYVLPNNLKKAQEQFRQVPMMLEAFEYWMGPYPFYEDGFKLVEVPYLGMEHQSSVTYGNGYQNGYLGMDRSGSGMGLLFDYIIIHEAGHEWFANNITASDNADMWIHEGFTAYTENLYLDYHFGKDTASQYVRGTRSRIKNDRPIQGTYGVNNPGSGDMYRKGSNMLHTLRFIIDDDDHWREILRGLNSHFYHQTITTKDLTEYINDRTTHDLSKFFEQYIQDVRIPVLEYRLFPGGVEYRWSNCVDGFHMPVDVTVNEKKYRLTPGTALKRLRVEGPESLEVDPNFYVATLRL